MVSSPSKSRVPFLVSLFNFQGPIAILFRRQLNEYITYPRSCQYFFESFLGFFRINFVLCFRSLASARIYYHFAQEKSRVFSHFSEAFRPLFRVFPSAFKVVGFGFLSSLNIVYLSFIILT